MKKNENCILRYCPTCKTRITQTYAREEDNSVIRTRKCKKCGYIIKTAEVKIEEYNSTIRKLNRIIEVMAEV